MDTQLLTQLRSWNPWWQQGAKGIDRYKDPEYKRELYNDVKQQFNQGSQIVSIVGMRQVGKSTIMRQLIRELLAKEKVDPRTILYVSFDDPYIRASYDPKSVFDDVVAAYAQSVLENELDQTKGPLYFFFDEIHQLPNWERTLKSYYDRSFPVQYMVSGSSSLRIQQKNRESLLGRISEHTLWPFSFREYAEYHAANNKDARLLEIISQSRTVYERFLETFAIDSVFDDLQKVCEQANVWYKQQFINYLKKFIVCGGFPRVWQQPDFASQQRTLWEQHVGKVLFEDLPQVAHLRKVKDLEFLYVRLVDFDGKEAVLSELQRDLKIHWATLNRYLDYLRKTFLVFRIDRTKSKRVARKRRSGNVKFYVTDVALRNALRKKTEEVYHEPEEMAYIAENLVCTAVQRWLIGVRREDHVAFFKDKSGEVDFVVKHLDSVMPIEVKWRTDIPALKTLDKLTRDWNLSESMLITKDHDVTFRDGRLSIPLWCFLLLF